MQIYAASKLFMISDYYYNYDSSSLSLFDYVTGNSPRSEKGTSSSVKDRSSSSKGKVKNNLGSWGGRRLRGTNIIDTNIV